MIVVIPFCKADADSALRLIQWIGELGKQSCSCILVAGSGVDYAKCFDASNQSFGSVEVIKQAISLKDESHPIGPNLMFETTLKHMVRSGIKEPFLWLESDAVPMRPDWLQVIQAEYVEAVKSKKTILAYVSCLGDERFPPEIPSGIAVYPPEAWRLYGRLQTNRTVAWDVQFAKHVMPMVQHTKSIQVVVTRQNPPTFIPKRVPNMKRNQMALTDIRGDAVLFHPSKDGTLIKLLQETRKPKFTMPVFVDHDPLEMGAPDEPWTPGTPWNIEDYMATVPMIRVPRKAPKVPERSNRIIHCVQRWKPNRKDIDRRVHFAVLSWLKLYENGDMIPCHVWEPFGRDATILGDARKLPFLRDILQAGMAKAKPDDIVLLTNDDSVLHPNLGNIIFERLAKSQCVCTGRLNYVHPAKPDFTDREWPTNISDIGRDAFAFRMDWLSDNFHRVPDMLLAEAQFDIVLGTMIRLANGVKCTLKNRELAIDKAELPYGYVQHEEHIRGWNQGPTPGQKHNIQLAAKWYRDNGQPHLIDFDYTQ